MALKHADIWRGIDRLAERHGLSVSGLALKAGLSSTIFNASKREHNGRKRWPSTESIAQILQATGANISEFVALAEDIPQPRATVPLLGYGEAGRAGYFDEDGMPAGHGWEEVDFPNLRDPHAFALEISGRSMEPLYREGDRVVVSPAEKPRKGDRVVARTKTGEVMIKQLGRATNNTVELLSLNPEFPAITMQRKDIEWMHRILWASQ